MQRNKNLWERGVDLIVDSLGYAVVRFAPLLAPIPSIMVILEVSGGSWFAWLTGITLEVVGYAIGDKMVESIRRKVLPMRQAAIPLVLYALVIEGLMLGYKVIPAWTGGATLAEATRASVSILYPFFTLAGAGLYALHEYLKELRTDEQESKLEDRTLSHQRKQAELDAYRAKLEQDLTLEREKALAELRIKEQRAASRTFHKGHETLRTSGTDGQETFHEIDDEIDVKRSDAIGKKIVRYYLANPGATMDELTNALSKSKPTLSREIAALEALGVLHSQTVNRRKMVTVNGNHEEYLRGEA